ncbi:LOW QUALITY PROTEIN: hypothetical protein PanWU01x14_152500 [Parasponia andersonii]|uniref:Retrotransposon gag domain-containing protein n=1 Tax=Parasponia andersonii TaxID=3476 RepID=A0A2P5CHC4_PARAD|nr:LOW QUALITY PROTEIN: hypothetical protein PanWU01x14_152500 [Parasponia andersonii]
MKQGDLNVTEYFNTLSNLWQELDLFQEIEWHCKEDGLKYQKQVEKERVFDFLHGLKQRSEVRGRMLGVKPPPGIREVFTEVRREEARKREMLGSLKSPDLDGVVHDSALVAKRTFSPNNFSPNNGDQRGNRRNNRPWCDHC